MARDPRQEQGIIKQVAAVVIGLLILALIFGVDVGEYINFAWIKEKAITIFELIKNFYDGYLAGYIKYVFDNIKRMIDAAVRAVQGWI